MKILLTFCILVMGIIFAPRAFASNILVQDSFSSGVYSDVGVSPAIPTGEWWTGTPFVDPGKIVGGFTIGMEVYNPIGYSGCTVRGKIIDFSGTQYDSTNTYTPSTLPAVPIFYFSATSTVDMDVSGLAGVFVVASGTCANDTYRVKYSNYDVLADGTAKFGGVNVSTLFSFVVVGFSFPLLNYR